MIDLTTPQCSDQMAKIVMEGVREVLDRSEIAALGIDAGVNQPVPAAGWTIGALKNTLAQLEVRHGLLGSRGIALRVGRASFLGIVRAYGSEDGFEDVEYRLLPVRRRARAGLEKLAAVFNCACGLRIVVDTEPAAWVWTISDCPQCADPLVESTMSHFMLGVLQSYLSWISGGKVFQVDETACRANGDPDCIIRIQRLPLE